MPNRPHPLPQLPRRHTPGIDVHMKYETRALGDVKAMRASGEKLCVILFFAACLFAPAVAARAQDAPTATAQGARPALRLKSVDGKTYDVAEMRGEIVLASFGATWCQPCHAEVAALEELRAEYKDKPVRFLWVSIESEEELSDSLLRHRAKGMGIKMPVLRDADGRAFAQFTARRRMPLVVVFDREGALAAAPMFGMGEPEAYKARVREKLDAALRENAKTAQTNTTTGR